MKYRLKQAQEQTEKSLPAWECGLKYFFRGIKVRKCRVTPCVGVWIEISNNFSVSPDGTVTPCVGVWIEIKCN